MTTVLLNFKSVCVNYVCLIENSIDSELIVYALTPVALAVGGKNLFFRGLYLKLVVIGLLGDAVGLDDPVLVAGREAEALGA